MEKYKFDAFISYRHCELDKFVAENLHRILETYELPKEIQKKLNTDKKAFKRVFRDQEELPLTSNLEDPIIEALENSKYLIVICSPRLKDSLWCKKEIETFKKLRGRKNIFCVLIEGEPSESFPEAVTYDYKTITLDNGKTKKEKILVEPLAADVRGNSKREVLKKLKEEKLRLIAPMYNLDYDDLRQRHKIWKQKQMIHTAFGIAIAAILFLIYSLAMIIKINLQQNVLAEYHAKSLITQASDYLNNDDRYNAVKSSYQSITNFYGIVMPYTSDGEYMLTESLGLYDAGLSYKAIKSLNVDGIATYIRTSYDNKIGAVYDESYKITLFKTSTLDKIGIYDVDSYYNEYKFGFMGNDRFVYINNDGNIRIINVEDGSLLKEIDVEDRVTAVRSNEIGKYLVYITDHNIYIYDFETDTLINTISSKETYKKEMLFTEDGKYVFVGSEVIDYDINKDDKITIHTIKLKDGNEVNKFSVNAGYINGIMTIDSTAYFLLNNSKGTKYNGVLVSYNYISGNVNYVKTFDNVWSKFINRSYPDGNHIAIGNYDTINVINASNGEIVEVFNVSSEIMGLYSYLSTEVYVVFLKDGSVNYLNMESRNAVEYMGKYEFNVDKYSKMELSENGYLLIPNNDNRVILYEAKANQDVEQVDMELDYVSNDSISSKDMDNIKDEYNVTNKSLVKRAFYDTDNKVVFINYTNGDICIYDVDSKKLINKLTDVGDAYHYFGKDKYGRTYIGDISNSYILDSSYNKVGHIKSLAKVSDDKVIITSNKKYYSIKIYTLDEIKNIAKNYLGDFELEEDLEELPEL